ncbi:MAG: 4Fe-4S dicluster domain-containing protein [Armatimonadetes bacterium]|nr:4Fe-4S dicluster domain-containing protein [Armatimonadota bacterium]
MDRRRFLQLASVTGAAATVAGCATRSHDQLIPYLIPIEDVIPGVSVEYATVCRECPAGCGMIAHVREGRAHKVEGNPDHPINRGALCIRGQASLQGLYNPDRIRQPLARDPSGRLQPIPWETAKGSLLRLLNQAQNNQVAWLGQLETGALDRLVDQWLAAVAPSRMRLRYEPFAYEPLRAAHSQALGDDGLPDYRIADARMLLSFGADFLETWISNVEYTRAFSAWRQARREGKHRGRYVFLAPRVSLTGANADEWIRVRPGTEGLVARALRHVVEAEKAMPATTGSEVPALAAAAGVGIETIERIGREFARESPSLALPIGFAGTDEQATAANEEILRLNEAAGYLGRTIVFGRPHVLSAAANYAAVLDLIQAMREGRVALLFIHHANPLYTIPPAAGFTEALGRVPNVVSFSSYLDETTERASLVMPDHTPLESWGEYSPRPGVTGLMQPVVSPVFDTRATGDVLLASAARLGHDLGVRTWQEYLRQAHPLAEEAWRAALKRGGIFPPEAESPGTSISLPTSRASSPAPQRPQPPSAGEGHLFLHIYPSLHFFDGRTANRPWAQEIPDPISKAVWGSWAEIHPDAAARLGARDGDVLVLTSAQGRIEVPAFIREEVHPEAISLQLGQGHTHYGRYATGTGVNPLALLEGAPETPSGALVVSGLAVEVTRIPIRRPLVVLQTSRRQVSDEIARSVTLAELTRLAKEGRAEAEARPTFYAHHPHPEHRWGMAIDLDRCIGCNACAAACYAENNIPIVGREQCFREREMAWLWIENYVGSTPPRSDQEPERADARKIDMRFLPMLCQQCDNAPCEYVCPVYASVHSSEGLNQQVYNRCVGTRYCSNNCPYKVRRFNWFTYEFPEPLDQQLNPDVIHRTKGVMEKCTFCIQRIRRRKIEAKAEGRPLRDGEIQTACQQTCPAEAIIFGDLNDPNSRVRQLAASPRGYGVLAELNTNPGIIYLARVRAE